MNLGFLLAASLRPVVERRRLTKGVLLAHRCCNMEFRNCAERFVRTSYGGSVGTCLGFCL